MKNKLIAIRKIEAVQTLVNDFPMTLGEANAREDRNMQQPSKDYFSFLSDAVDEAERRMNKAGAVPADPGWRDAFSSLALYTAQTHRVDIELALLKGKPTKKYFHVNLYRLESGRYELNAYVL